MTTQPLPDVSTVCPSHPRAAHYQSAYRFVVAAEANAVKEDLSQGTSQASLGAAKRNLCYARIIGHLIATPLSDTALTTVVNEVTSCLRGISRDAEMHQKIYELGLMYLSHFILPFKKFACRTPAPSGHVSQPSFDTRRDQIEAVLVEFPTNHATAKSNALVRDGYRCLVSGHYDKQSVSSIADVSDESDKCDAAPVSTNCCHIIPECVNTGIAGACGDAEKTNAASFWTIMSNFGEETLLVELNGLNIHRLENVLTLSHSLHEEMDLLQLWFEKVSDDPNSHRYYIRLGRFTNAKMRIPEEIDFTQHAPSDVLEKVSLPLPSPRYLRIHAACCTLAHMSGASEILDLFDSAYEDEQTLSSDGSSAHLLQTALLSRSRPRLQSE